MSRYVLLVIGIVLIWFGFFTLVDVRPWTNQIWLDFFVVIAVFVFNFIVITFIGQSKSDFRFRIASRGILWTSCGLYSIVSIAALLAAHAMSWSFSFSLFFQLVLVFGLLLALYMASIADHNAYNVQKDESISISSLDQLRDTFNRGISVTAKLTASNAQMKKTLDGIGEDLRYLSALSGKEARQLDAAIESEIKAFFSMLRGMKTNDLNIRKTDIDDFLDRIRELIRQRKNCKNSIDHKEMFS